MTKPKYIKYRCKECMTPCNYFYELPGGRTESNFMPPTKCISNGYNIPKWERVDRFTKNGI